MDELDHEGPPMKWGMVAVDGIIKVDGTPAGTTDGFYLLDAEPWSEEAFWTFWDMEGWTCEIYEELIDPGETGDFRQPLPRLMEMEVGILFIRLIALKPEFRGKGLGREVFKQWSATWCDRQVGVVLLDACPLQRRPEGFDEYDDEVRDLPWESEAADAERLAKHLRGWGFHRVAGTRFMVGSPRWLDFERATHLMGVEVPPDPLEDLGDPWDEDGKREPRDDDDIPF